MVYILYDLIEVKMIRLALFLTVYALFTPSADQFWDHWGDGQAEISSYELSIPRYGESRPGTTVAIFVTEPFSAARRVKSDRSASDDRLQVIKLNLVKDFATGIYDYNTMLSTFVPLETGGELTEGRATKVSYSSQEWCGHAYHELLLDRAGASESVHSYFDGESAQDRKLSLPAGGVSEDSLLLWARGLAEPKLAKGESVEAPLLTSLQTARLDHQELRWRTATFSRADKSTFLESPAGRFEVERWTVQLEDGSRWEFDVELAPPQRVISWRRPSGERSTLIKSERLPYWRLNGNRDLKALDAIGLKPRPARTP